MTEPADDYAWNGKPLAHMTREELLAASLWLAAQLERALDANDRLERGYTHGGARPPYTKPKPVEDYGRTPL